MKVKIRIPQEVDLKTLHVEADVRYWEDTEVNGEHDTVNGDNIPCKEGKTWKPIIDLDNGKIINWKQGVTASVHYKVCDAGTYSLKDADGKTILSIDNGYVPSILCPADSGYGDYIIMNIDENGSIEDFDADIEDFLSGRD